MVLSLSFMHKQPLATLGMPGQRQRQPLFSVLSSTQCGWVKYSYLWSGLLLLKELIIIHSSKSHVSLGPFISKGKQQDLRCPRIRKNYSKITLSSLSRRKQTNETTMEIHKLQEVWKEETSIHLTLNTSTRVFLEAHGRQITEVMNRLNFHPNLHLAWEFPTMT